MITDRRLHATDRRHWALASSVDHHPAVRGALTSGSYVSKQVMQAEQTATNEWKGTVIFDGAEAAATVTQTGSDSIEIQRCRAAILCQTLEFNRV